MHCYDSHSNHSAWVFDRFRSFQKADQKKQKSPLSSGLWIGVERISSKRTRTHPTLGVGTHGLAASYQEKRWPLARKFRALRSRRGVWIVQVDFSHKMLNATVGQSRYVGLPQLLSLYRNPRRLKATHVEFSNCRCWLAKTQAALGTLRSAGCPHTVGAQSCSSGCSLGVRKLPG